MNNKLKAVIVGCGNIFPMHAVPILKSKDAQLVAVCDILQSRAESAAKWTNAKAYTDYETMLQAEQPDTVHICTPHYLHAPMACTALKQGCNVLCEKPMAILQSDAENMLFAAKLSNKTLGIIFQNRFNAGSQLVKKTLDDGLLGDIKAARILLTWDRSEQYYSKSDWKGTWDKEGGGVIIDQAIHTMDLMRWLINKPVISVSASISNRTHPQISVEDTAEGVVEFEGGIRGAFYTMNHYCADLPVLLELTCTKGKAVIEGPKASVTFLNGTSLCADNDPSDIFEYGDVKQYWGTSHVKQINNYYGALKGREQLYIAAENAYLTQKMICSIYEAGKKQFFGEK